MGSNNSIHVAIDVNRPNSFFYAGELVSGTVNINITEGPITAEEIYIVLTGETGYQTTHTYYHTNGRMRTQTDYHTATIFSNKKIFESSGTDKKELNYNSGQYSWRFEIQLPFQPPPTISQVHRHPYVRYYLKFVIDRPWYKRNIYEILNLTVLPCVNLLNVPQCLMPSVFGNHNRKDVILKGHISKLGYIPGEVITGTLEIENPQEVVLKEIRLSLVQHYRVKENTGKEKIFETTLPTIVNTKASKIMEQFSASIPAILMAPSYQFYGGFEHMVNIDVNYMLEFDVEVEDMFTDFDVNIPITIGNDCRGMNSTQEQVNSENNLVSTLLPCSSETIQHDENHLPQ